VGPATTSFGRRLGTVVLVVVLVASSAWLLSRSFASPNPSTATLDTRPGPAAVDVTATRGCYAGDLPGFTQPRWITVQSGYVRTDGSAYLQCQISHWADEQAAEHDFAQRSALLDGVVSFTASREAAWRTERMATANDGPGVRSYAERSPTASTRLTWISVTRHGEYAGVVSLHSYVDPAPVALSEFEGLVALVLDRMAQPG
jgi:hypothetical protein